MEEKNKTTPGSLYLSFDEKNRVLFASVSGQGEEGFRRFINNNLQRCIHETRYPPQ